MQVDAYWNIHKKMYSVRKRSTGRVIQHAHRVFLRDCQFVVQQGGQARVRAEKKKNVHAFVRGTWIGATPETRQTPEQGDFEIARYNPYLFKTFVNARTEEPIYHASEVCLTSEFNDNSIIPKIFVAGGE